jgi:hypothetical protein
MYVASSQRATVSGIRRPCATCLCVRAVMPVPDDLLAVERDRVNTLLERAAFFLLKFRRLREATTDPVDCRTIDARMDGLRADLFALGRRAVQLDIAPQSSDAVH